MGKELKIKEYESKLVIMNAELKKVKQEERILYDRFYICQNILEELEKDEDVANYKILSREQDEIQRCFLAYNIQNNYYRNDFHMDMINTQNNLRKLETIKSKVYELNTKDKVCSYIENSEKANELKTLCTEKSVNRNKLEIKIQKVNESLSKLYGKSNLNGGQSF